MERVLIDQSLVNPRKNVVVNNSSTYGGFMTSSHNTFPSSASSYSPVSQLFLNLNAGTGGSTASFGLFGSRPSPSRYSSLPSFFSTPSVVAPPPAFPPPTPPPVRQPPLLPLPFSKSATLPSPSPTNRIAAFNAAVTTARSRDNRNKTKPDGNPRKETRSSGTPSVRSDPPKGERVSVVPQKSAQKPTTPPAAAAEREEKVEKGGEEKKKRFAMESVYSLSPPPSSLPLPTFFLKRPKAASAAAAATCVAEAMRCGNASGGAGGGASRVNAGATDDLRRHLRL